jgi:hypothetical protein
LANENFFSGGFTIDPAMKNSDRAIEPLCVHIIYIIYIYNISDGLTMEHWEFVSQFAINRLRERS